MRKLGRVSMTVLLLMLLPAVGSAQSDLCIPSLPTVPTEAKAEQLRIDATERAHRERSESLGCEDVHGEECSLRTLHSVLCASSG